MPDKPNPTEWDAADAVALRTFLADNRKFLHALQKRIPKLVDSAEFAVRALSLERREGAREMLAAITNMALQQDDTFGDSPFIDPAAI